MTSGLDELYQEVLLDHSKHPRNCRAMGAEARRAQGYNPLCGDRVTVFVAVEGDRVVDVSFTGEGCAICTASASVMTESVKGRDVGGVNELYERFHGLLTGESGGGTGEAGLGKLDIFAGVRKYPIRVKCATLPWHTLKAALEDQEEAVSTE